MWKFFSGIFGGLLINIIKIYQKTLSFDHGPLKHYYPHGFCRFYPSCSEYGIQAIEKYGPIRGSFKSAWRVLRFVQGT